MATNNPTPSSDKMNLVISQLESRLIQVLSPLLTQLQLPLNSEGIQKFLIIKKRWDQLHLQQNEDKGQSGGGGSSVRRMMEGVEQLQNEIKDLNDLFKGRDKGGDTTELIQTLKKMREKQELEREILKLEKQLHTNPPDLEEKEAKLFRELKKTTGVLELECHAIEEQIRHYEALGPKFAQLREKYKNQEDEIQTKLWVKEELERMRSGSGAGGTSSLDNSFV